MGIRNTEKQQGVRMRRRCVLGLAWAAMLVVAALVASPVQAVTTPDFEFGSSGTGAGQFSEPNDIAIYEEGETTYLYITDRTLNRVSKFNGAGEFQLMWGKDVVETGEPGDLGTGFEICHAGEVCKAGAQGGESGSLDQPQGIGVDQNTGAVYVQDTDNIRIQKFDKNGNFVLMWGKEVNETTGGNTCTAVSGDTCQTGFPAGFPLPEEEPEPTPFGLFFGWHLGFLANENRPALTVDEDGYVYVGECCAVPQETIPGKQEWPHARIQKFDSSGNYVSVLIPPKGDGNEFRRPRSLALNTAGSFYVRDDPFFVIARGIIKYDSSSFTPEGVPDAVPDQVWGTPSSQERPFDVDPTNLYIVGIESNCNVAEGSGMNIVEWHPSTEEVDCTYPAGAPSVGNAQAMEINAHHKLYLLVRGSEDKVIVYTTPSATAPEVTGGPQAKEVSSNKAVIEGEVAANLDDTTYHMEYGTSPCFEITCESTEESASIGAAYKPKPVQGTITGLQADTDYYFRIAATNGAGSDTSAEGIIHTYAKPTVDSSCPNHLARQQTHASLLLDCRAYELVTPEEQGGYDVESSVVPGQEPFGGYPHAGDRALFGIHNGGIPGVGKPTNRGIDPYVATRDAANERWSTEYVGIPADVPSLEPFSSTLVGADSGLSSFAFGGDEICDPCFGDGSAGIPLHKPDGTLVQGMVGSEPIAYPEPAGEVRRPLSADGSHFVFGSEQQFEEEGNDEDGNATIYDRDLQGGFTQVVSTMPDGSTIEAGGDVAELDISTNGSRILIGKLVKEEAGNKYWDLYMHIGNSPGSVEVVDTPSGVLYAGMTSDGTDVFFTTADKLEGATGGDGDSSTDLFRADVGSSSPAPLTRISTGEGAGNGDGCDPAGNSYNPEDWNVISGSPADCSVVAIGGGGGIATATGNVYFLSPELLDEAAEGKDEVEEIEGDANLYLAEPGSDPHFVASLEPDNQLVVHGVSGAESRHTADFQTTPNGDAAVFASASPLTGFENAGAYEVFRYDAVGDGLDCLSCNPTLEVPTTDAALASNGLSITDDGRVFFNTGESLVLRDTNGARDVYEWNEGGVELISSGQDRADSGLLTVTADGVDAFIFTRETLAANDKNGTLMKLYDAREEGGFFVIPSPPGCRASDECHGAGSEPPAPLVMGTLRGTLGNERQAACNVRRLSRRAKRLSRQAKSLRRRARKASGRRAANLRKRASRKARGAKRGAKATKRCRRRLRSAR